VRLVENRSPKTKRKKLKMSEENKALARRYIEQVWNERRLDLYEEFIAEDIVLHSQPESSGRENVKERIGRDPERVPRLSSDN
jgi:hypothetical protein